MKNVKKVIALVAAMVLVLAIGIGGTLAYLTSTTQKITNTFTVGKVNITLVEHQYNPNKPEDLAPEVSGSIPTVGADGQSYKLIPGTVYAKDPTVTVEADSEDCYLFVKFEETNNTFGTNNDKIVEFTNTMAEENSGWTQGTANSDGITIPKDVWYREVKTTDATKSWNLIKDNKVTINDDLTNDVVSDDDFVAPELSFTAYAIQKSGFDVYCAWKEISETYLSNS